MKYAIIENNTVVNIALADSPLADNWIDATGAQIGDLYDGQAFTKPAPTPEEIAEQKDSQFLNEVSQIKQGYTEDEIKSWAKQEAEARGWTADNTYPTPLLDGIISQTQESKSTLAATIITKADLYAAAFGAALGRKRA